MEKLTGTPFKCPLKNRIQQVFASGMICMGSIAILLRTRKWNVPGATSNMIAVLFLTNGTANVMMYWIANNIFAMSAAKEIIKVAEVSLHCNNFYRKNCFKIFFFWQQMIRKGRYLDLRRLVVIWTMLCDLNDEFIRCHSIRFLLLFCIIIITEVIGAYSTVILLVHFPDKSMGLTYLCATMFCILCLLTFCESANSVTENVSEPLYVLICFANYDTQTNAINFRWYTD